MRKIVKPQVYKFDSKPISIGEPLPENAVSIADAEEKIQLTPEQLAAIEEKQQKKKIADDAKRFNEAVEKRANELFNAKRDQMNEEYQRIISSGNANAERMIADAKVKTRAVFDIAAEECQKLKERAKMDGFEAGFEAGKSEAIKKCEKYLEASAKLMSEINAKKEAYYISHEYELCNTVLDMVKKITMSEIQTDPAIIDKIAADAAKNFRNSDYVKISLAKGEASRELVTDKDFVKSLITFIPEIEVEELEPEDAPAGTIVLDDGSEIIDASIPTQLDFLKEIMKNSRGESANSEEVE